MRASPPPEDGFDLITSILGSVFIQYVLSIHWCNNKIFQGPEEDLPRKLNCMEFVSHASSDYFKVSGPYPGVDLGKANHYQNKNVIWTSIGNSRATNTLEIQ